MFRYLQRSLLWLSVLAAFALGGGVVAGAADNTTTTNSSTSTADPDGPPWRPGGWHGRGRHGAHRPDRALSSSVAAKVKKAALAKVRGATVERVEAGGPYSTPYHAHIVTADGKRRVVLVDSDFRVTAVTAETARLYRDKDGRRSRRWRERPLTGTTKQKVEQAVLAKYPGAQILRSETSADSQAAYEAHIKTADGDYLEVLVDREFKVVATGRWPGDGLPHRERRADSSNSDDGTASDSDADT